MVTGWCVVSYCCYDPELHTLMLFYSYYEDTEDCIIPHRPDNSVPLTFTERKALVSETRSNAKFYIYLTDVVDESKSFAIPQPPPQSGLHYPRRHPSLIRVRPIPDHSLMILQTYRNIGAAAINLWFGLGCILDEVSGGGVWDGVWVWAWDGVWDNVNMVLILLQGSPHYPYFTVIYIPSQFVFCDMFMFCLCLHSGISRSKYNFSHFVLID